VSSHLAARPSRGRRWADIGERAAWTLLQAGVGVSVVEALDVPPAWAVVIAGVLAAVKGELATKFGDGTASTLPGNSPEQPVGNLHYENHEES
jgi:hypothetical protein